MQDEPDRDLLHRFAQGDRDAFEELFRRYQGDVSRWILRIVREPAAAEDALVEAFWRAYRGRARFDPSRSFGAWMRTIATHTAIDQLNAARRRRWAPPADVKHLEEVGRVRPGAGTGHGAPHDSRLADEIRRAFASLPPKLRVVATLALIEECPQAEIAEALGVPVGTVKSRLFRATRYLRHELTRQGVRI